MFGETKSAPTEETGAPPEETLNGFIRGGSNCHRCHFFAYTYHSFIVFSSASEFWQITFVKAPIMANPAFDELYVSHVKMKTIFLGCAITTLSWGDVWFTAEDTWRRMMEDAPLKGGALTGNDPSESCSIQINFISEKYMFLENLVQYLFYFLPQLSRLG